MINWWPTRLLTSELRSRIREINGVKVLAELVPFHESKAIKTMSNVLEQELKDIIIAVGFISNDKPQLMITISKSLTEKGFHAGNLIREIAREIKGGGGGQPFFATAGGKDVHGLEKALKKLVSLVEETV